MKSSAYANNSPMTFWQLFTSPKICNWVYWFIYGKEYQLPCKRIWRL